MAVRPLDGEQPPRSIREDVEGPLALRRVRRFDTQALGRFVVAGLEGQVQVLPVGHLTQLS